MKANELMIGDWVSHNGIWNRIAPADLIPDAHKKWLEEAQPIPITPEILEKNGWKKVGEDERTGVPIMQIEYDGNAFWWTEMNGECGCEDVENEDGEEKFVKVFSCVRVCYVHELQHALKLCRIEKEIKL